MKAKRRLEETEKQRQQGKNKVGGELEKGDKKSRSGKITKEKKGENCEENVASTERWKRN
jgi:hypothetical protein